MNSNDTVKLTGALKIRINDEVVREVENLVVTVGKDWIASRMNGVVDAVMSHLAIGTGLTAAAVGDTILGTEVTRGALTTAGGVVVDNTIEFQCTFAADDPDITAPDVTAVTEAGIFNAGVAGVMLARTVFPVVNKGETDTMSITWTITIS